MSIVALKKNSRRFQTPISGRGHDGFSLVGGHRNIGIVGNTNLAKSVTRTRFRGNNPVGHGGCQGKYKLYIFNSGSCFTNDPFIIKSTVKNTKAAILKQYKWIHSAYPRYWVKSNSSMSETFSQGSYIKHLTSQYSNVVNNKNKVNNMNSQCKATSYHIGGKKYYKSFYSKESNNRPISCSQYITTGLYKKNNLPTPSCLQSFPMNILRNGCDVNYFTPQEAIAATALPKDWMNCNSSTNPNCVLRV